MNDPNTDPLREAVRAALERHYEEPNPNVRQVGHMAAGIYVDDCVVCEVHQAASARVHALRAQEEEEHRQTRIATEELIDHVFRDIR